MMKSRCFLKKNVINSIYDHKFSDKNELIFIAHISPAE